MGKVTEFLTVCLELPKLRLHGRWEMDFEEPWASLKETGKQLSSGAAEAGPRRPTWRLVTRGILYPVGQRQQTGFLNMSQK